jgi:pimeloyl-ACP methyl ester carboxylesterase
VWVVVSALLVALGLYASSAAVAAASRSSDADHGAAPPPGFRDGYASNDGVRIHFVVGGHGPALVLLHGWPETWRAWSQLAPTLSRTHTVVMVDTRGLGDSQPARTDAQGSYTALTLASDVHAVVAALGFQHIDLAGHDWGGAIALAYAARYRDAVDHLAIMEAPPTTDYLALVASLPNVLWWDSFVNGPRGDTAEQLVAKRERAFYAAVYHGGAPGGSISPESEARYVSAYSRHGSTHAGFEYFRQQDQGEKEVDALLTHDGKLTMPVLGVGGQFSMGALIEAKLHRVAEHVTGVVVPNANHWILDEDPGFVADQLIGFLGN